MYTGKRSGAGLETTRMRFLHAADIHLDSPLKGLARYEGAPVEALRGATRKAFVNLVDLALERQVDFLLLAGDLYDGDWPDYNTGLFFSRQIGRLSEAAIPVIGICGNHDAESRLTKGLRLPANVKMLSVDRPETYLLEGLKVAVHGQGFKDAAMWEDLSASYPVPVKGYFNIGMLHTSADGRPGHAPYAPCTVQGLKVLGYDYWALGHIHQREVLCEDPYIIFPGNLQGRHARETGPKGATMVTLTDGMVSNLEHVPLDVVRWEKVEVDISGLTSPEQVTAAVSRCLERCARSSDGRVLAARVVTVGESPVHSSLVGDPERWVAEIRSQALLLGRDDVWIEKVKFRSHTAVDVESMANQHDAFASLLEGVATLRGDEERLKALGLELFSDLESKLPHEWRHEEGALAPTSAEALREALDDIPHLLASRLHAFQEDRA